MALRSANLRIQGNGQGAVSLRTYLEELPSLVDEIDGGGLEATVHHVPLAEVESSWTAPERPGVRTVFIPCRRGHQVRGGRRTLCGHTASSAGFHRTSQRWPSGSWK